MNVKTGEVVADIMRSNLTVDDFAENYFKMLEVYHSPLCYPEDNDWGHFVGLRLLELGYKNMGYQDDDKTRLGFHADKEGRIEARRGGHDDYAIMLGICWLMKDKVTQTEWKPKTIESLHFSNRWNRYERQAYR
jgi:hypothetical protein